MLLVIFGAGASFDSADVPQMPVRPWLRPPPLAKELADKRFNEIAAELPNCLPIIDRLRHRMADNPDAFSLETELAKLTEASIDSAERRQQLAAFQIYLHRVVAKASNEWMNATAGLTRYLTLLNYIYDWHCQTGMAVRLATFNYDLLLDAAAAGLVADWRLYTFEDYISRSDFRLFKLHGSTSWSRVHHFNRHTRSVSAAMELAAANQLGEGLLTADPPREDALSSHDPDAGHTTYSVALPAIAIPMEGKTTFECPEPHIAALRADLPEVTQLLIVGWRAAEPHAVELLAGSAPQEGLHPAYALGIVSGSEQDSEETLRNLNPVAARGRLAFTEAGGFSAFIGNLGAHMTALHDATPRGKP
ncbi:hypothetical protein [Conexibacter sp. DBS9H8]|uniref:hypothetical protein n=1 Tax=Conexibacter sp. DBS9H8 TaxID=2937801 RepID=UPI00200C4E7E|nr:hypothetical protein [Conexibacter sp. DBS9H8]